jgi:hypothetical protein
MSAGVFAGIGSTLAAAPARGAAADGDGDALVAARIDELRTTLQRQVDFEEAPWRTVSRVRDQQRQFLRASHRYPEFIEVGVQVWESLHDWYILTHQPPVMNRLADGRYVLLFPFTTIVLRPDYEPGFVGQGFDGDRGGR